MLAHELFGYFFDFAFLRSFNATRHRLAASREKCTFAGYLSPFCMSNVQKRRDANNPSGCLSNDSIIP